MTPASGGSGTYAYDPLDNLRTSVVGTRNAVHNYNSSTNQLTSVTINGVPYSVGYDSQGNVNSRAGQAYTFDEGNRLTQATGLDSYTYDGLGRRTSSVSTAGTTRLNFYSLAGQLLYVRQQTGSTITSTDYIYLGGHEIAENNSASGITYVHTDALGSPVAHTNPAGTLLNQTRYEAYGNTAAGTVPTGIGFTGHVNDSDTGLVYMQQRYYDPIAARFLSMDPVTTDANTGAAFARYEYAQSNPYRYTDPDGREEAPARAEAGLYNYPASTHGIPHPNENNRCIKWSGDNV